VKPQRNRSHWLRVETWTIDLVTDRFVYSKVQEIGIKLFTKVLNHGVARGANPRSQLWSHERKVLVGGASTQKYLEL
jgi:hypothetical protein